MTPAELRRSRIAVLAYFFVLGAATATWSARLPAIKAALHLSDGRLGLALFAVPAGSVVTLAVSGRIADRFGPDRVIRAGGLACPLALVPIGAAGDLGWLMAALACYGAMAGLLDVAMNACGARLEVGYGRPILSSLHAGYSIAGPGRRRDRRPVRGPGPRRAPHPGRDRRRADRGRPGGRPPGSHPVPRATQC